MFDKILNTRDFTMTIETAKEYLKKFDKDKNIIELDKSSATVELAAAALNVIPARIAKTLSFKLSENCILVVTAGDVKVDNKKFKDYFHVKAKMLSPEEVIKFTTHPVGGVCPFGIKNNNVKIFCDVSLKRFNSVYPACGSSNSAIELTCDELFKISNSIAWIDVCKNTIEL